MRSIPHSDGNALKRLILREALRQPVILAFEDLHWIDGESQAFRQIWRLKRRERQDYTKNKKHRDQVEKGP